MFIIILSGKSRDEHIMRHNQNVFNIRKLRHKFMISAKPPVGI